MLYVLDREALQQISRLAGMKSAGAFTPDGAAVWRALAQAADAADAHMASREARGAEPGHPCRFCGVPFKKGSPVHCCERAAKAFDAWLANIEPR